MKKFLKLIAIPLICFFTGGALLPSAEAFDAAKIAKMQESTVRIVTLTHEDGENLGWSVGTGFIINESGNIITNQHVVDGVVQHNGVAQYFALRRVGGQTRVFRCKCEPSQQNKELDLAVLSSSIKAAPLVINTVEPAPLASVYSVGFPAIADAKVNGLNNAFIDAVLNRREDPAMEGDGVDITREMSENKRLYDMANPSFSKGEVRRIGYQSFYDGGAPVNVIDCDLNIGHGNSGGALLDAAGYVIAVVGRGTSKADPNGHVDDVKWCIAKSELVAFLQDHNIGFHQITFDVRKLGQMTARKKILISLAGACALVAAGLAFFLLSRRQPAHAPLRTTVINERIDQLLAARGVQAKPQPQAQPAAGAVWEFDIQGPGGFRQNVRLTDADFKRGRGRVVLGRNSDFSDVPVKHDSVSRQHLHFELRDSGIVVADRHSSNGTKVNGKSLGKPFRSQSLREGDSIQFGELTASVRRGF